MVPAAANAALISAMAVEKSLAAGYCSRVMVRYARDRHEQGAIEGRFTSGKLDGFKDMPESG